MFPLFIYFLLKTSYFTNKSGTQSFAHFLHIVESQHRKKKITSTNFDPFAGVQSKIGCLPLLNQKLVCSTSYSSSLKILLMVYLLGCVFFFFCMCATQLTNAKRKSTTKNAEITFQDLKWYTEVNIICNILDWACQVLLQLCTQLNSCKVMFLEQAETLTD